jgi:hypothetical protein
VTKSETRNISIIYAVLLVIWGLLWTYDYWKGHAAFGESVSVAVPRIAAVTILTSSGCLFMGLFCFRDVSITRISSHHLLWMIGGGISFAGLQVLFETWNEGEQASVIGSTVTSVVLGSIYGLAVFVAVGAGVLLNRWFFGVDDEGEP